MIYFILQHWIPFICNAPPPAFLKINKNDIKSKISENSNPLVNPLYVCPRMAIKMNYKMIRNSFLMQMLIDELSFPSYEQFIMFYVSSMLKIH